MSNMPSHRIRTRKPHGHLPARLEVLTDADQLEAVAHDAANYPGGNALALVRPRNEAEIAAAIQRYPQILPIGSQSSLTGGAAPQGSAVLSLAQQNQILERGTKQVRVQPGISLRELREALEPEDKYCPFVPSFDGASVGGIIATNAAGPATFKYGTTRSWVQAITVVLATGEVLDIERGQCRAHPAGYFEIDGSAGLRRLPIPSYQLPNVPKCSAGYYAAPQMDLIDLFIGAEGTLGVVSEAILRVISPSPGTCLALIPCLDEAQALALTRTLRETSHRTWETSDPRGLDVSAIEYLDARSLEVLREDGSEKRNHITLGPETRALLLVQFELQPEQVARAFDDLAQALEADAPDVPIVRFARILEELGRLEETELVMPHERGRIEQIFALREAVPSGVNARVLRSKREHDPLITKMAADMIVPFEHLETMMRIFRAGFEKHGLDYAIWGHISDGNMHPNLLPRSLEDVHLARQIILEGGRAVIALSGSPLAEHGVGRNPIKQTLLKELYGAEGLKQMVAVKQILDPEWKLAPGNLFPAP
jgi:D-lactate dehydrogenase (cytochrome)